MQPGWRLVFVVKVGTMYGILRVRITDTKEVLYKPATRLWREKMLGTRGTTQELFTAAMSSKRWVESLGQMVQVF